MSTGGGIESTFAVPAILACIAPDPVLYWQPMENGSPWGGEDDDHYVEWAAPLDLAYVGRAGSDSVVAPLACTR